MANKEIIDNLHEAILFDHYIEYFQIKQDNE